MAKDIKKIIDRLRQTHRKMDPGDLSPAARSALLTDLKSQREEAYVDGSELISSTAKERLMEQVHEVDQQQIAEEREPALQLLKRAYIASRAPLDLSASCRAEVLRQVRKLRPDPEVHPFWYQVWKTGVVAVPCTLILFAYSVSGDFIPDFPLEQLIEAEVGF